MASMRKKGFFWLSLCQLCKITFWKEKKMRLESLLYNCSHIYFGIPFFICQMCVRCVANKGKHYFVSGERTPQIIDASNFSCWFEREIEREIGRKGQHKKKKEEKEEVECAIVDDYYCNFNLHPKTIWLYFTVCNRVLWHRWRAAHRHTAYWYSCRNIYMWIFVNIRQTAYYSFFPSSHCWWKMIIIAVVVCCIQYLSHSLLR